MEKYKMILAFWTLVRRHELMSMKMAFNTSLHHSAQKPRKPEIFDLSDGWIPHVLNLRCALVDVLSPWCMCLLPQLMVNSDFDSCGDVV